MIVTGLIYMMFFGESTREAKMPSVGAGGAYGGVGADFADKKPSDIGAENWPKTQNTPPSTSASDTTSTAKNNTATDTGSEKKSSEPSTSTTTKQWFVGIFFSTKDIF